MTIQEIVEQIEHLSADDQRQLFKIMKQRFPGIGVDYARGLLATDQPAPSDEEVENAYADYLDEKYH
ncbi:MAG TPA: hypothetical protein VHD90_19650 [Phototrophicaceae bacterium]|nr:hypothetical protein [Phototrophicaceae bacterium]